MNKLNFKKWFTLIEIMIALAIYWVLIFMSVYLVNSVNQKKDEIVEYNYTLYEKKVLWDYDKLVCYKKKWNSMWENRIITDNEKKICNTFKNDSDIKDFVINLKNIWIKKYYTILYLYTRNKDMLYSIDITDDYNFIPPKDDNEIFAPINKKTLQVSDYSWVSMISFSLKTNNYIKHFLFIDNSSLNN